MSRRFAHLYRETLQTSPLIQFIQQSHASQQLKQSQSNWEDIFSVNRYVALYFTSSSTTSTTTTGVIGGQARSFTSQLRNVYDVLSHNNNQQHHGSSSNNNNTPSPTTSSSSSSSMSFKGVFTTSSNNGVGGSSSNNSPAKIRRKFPFGSTSNKGSASSSSNNKPSSKSTSSSSSSLVSQEGKENTSTFGGLEVIVVSLDKDSESYSRTLMDTNGWWTLPPENLHAKNRLIRCFRVQNTPALVLIDTSSLQVVTWDGKRALLDDPSGQNFPWLPPNVDELLTGGLLKHEQTQKSAAEESSGDGGKNSMKIVDENFGNINDRHKLLLFAANWCPPCRSFMKQLRQSYAEMKRKGIEFEVIYCSSDRSPDSFTAFYNTMDWMALPYGDPRIKALTRLFNIHGIPSLLILNEKNEIVTRHGRNALLADPSGEKFPWYPEALLELNDLTLPRLKEELSLIMFTEGTPEDVDFSKGLMESLAQSELRFTRENFCPNNARRRRRSFTTTETSSASAAAAAAAAAAAETTRKDGSAAEIIPNDNEEKEDATNGNDNQKNMNENENQGNSEARTEDSSAVLLDPIKYFYTGEDPICEALLDGMGLGDAPFPLILILDIVADVYYVCEEPDISMDILHKFVRDFRSGRIQPKWLPVSAVAKLTGSVNVGGIPVGAISAVLGMSPSQNSMSGHENNNQQQQQSATTTASHNNNNNNNNENGGLQRLPQQQQHSMMINNGNHIL